MPKGKPILVAKNAYKPQYGLLYYCHKGDVLARPASWAKKNKPKKKSNVKK